MVCIATTSLFLKPLKMNYNNKNDKNRDMGIKTFFALLMMLITIAAMCSPLYLIWHGFTMNGSVLVRICLIVVGLILCRLFKPISNLFDKDFKIF